MANATLGCCHGAQKRRVVIIVAPQAKPRAQVADFGAVKKALATRYLVGNIGLAKRLLKRLGLVVGAVKQRKVAKLFVLFARLRQRPLCAQALDAGHGALGLVLFVVGVHYAHRLALAQFAEQRFGVKLGVGADHIVGGAQDGAGGAVVLLQRDDFERWKLDWQFPQVVQCGAAPAVDGLVVVAHGGEARFVGRVAAHQQLEHFILGGVGVLVLVHQHMAHQPLPLAAHFRVVPQQFQRQADQVVKIHALVGGQALLVARHHGGGDAGAVVFGLRQRLLRI